MTVFQLECCRRLADSLNYTQASKTLYITQPVLSRTISQAEEELGFRIFDRTTRNVSLTPAGEVFVQGCAKVLDIYKDCVESAKLAERGVTGKVTIGIFLDGFQRELLELVHGVRLMNPNISIAYKEYGYNELKKAFDAGEVDLVEDIFDRQTPDDADCFVIGKCSICAVVPVQSEFARYGTVCVDDIKNERFLVLSHRTNTYGNNLIYKIEEATGIKLNIVGEASYVRPLLMRVANGEGITILPDEFSQDAKSHISFVPIRNIGVSTEILMWKKDNPNPALPQFIENARTVLRS